MSSRPIRFFHRGALVEVARARPTRTVLEWLREDARCTGTKEGCNEGDCGACTVVIGRLAAPGDATAVRGLTLETVNACIQLLPTLDGKALFSVEDLAVIQAAAAHAADELHPVQRALVECHGSQCGFCTPGFVMSLWSVYEQGCASGGAVPSRQRLADELSGNLCRCTGYRPILDAGERMFELPATALDTGPAVAALDALRADPPLLLEDRDGRFEAPRTLEALASARLQRPRAVVLAGSTDIGLWVTKQLRELPDLLFLGEVDELRQITRTPAELRIGAGASLEAAFAALAAEWPSLREVWLRFASVPIRHAGTMGGNVANGSPIGDSAPVLMALDAELELRRGPEVRRLALASFYVDYMKNELQPGEFVQAIVVPLDAVAQVRVYKISKRFDCDISAVCAALAIELDGDDTVRRVRFAFGGMAATVRRAERAEAAVLGQPWSDLTLRAAQRGLADDFRPLTDMRASADYRMQVAQNLLRRFWLETRAREPLAHQEVSVWQIRPAAPPESAPGALA